LLWSGGIADALAPLCVGRLSGANAFTVEVCTNTGRSIALLALAIFAFTILLYWPQFSRGLSDVGFIGAGLRGERARRERL
jgi:hypothetical protein